MTKKIEDVIIDANNKGYESEAFEAADGSIVLQVWPHSMTMFEYIFNSATGTLEKAYQHIPGFCVKTIYPEEKRA